ncbi:hypothetical protein C0Q70_01556 [Pomacea canaliculata]|uniref:G-protein coupled receptors family 1 profile domain-containing protein n=2 Tax=Pomacea canaliculata TaxID=400727 RepID=A0A2T7PZT8_POMCA|nr:hypothetical protein C0Q70_01556 [Pomacea canaliculata]
MVFSIWTLGEVLLVPWLVYYEQYQQETPLQVLHMCHQSGPTSCPSAPTSWAPSLWAPTSSPCSSSSCATSASPCACGTAERRGTKDNRLIRHSKMKVVKMLAVMVSLFALSWLPLHAIYMKLYFDPSFSPAELDMVYYVAVPVAQWLELSNSGINPIIYCFFSKNFRRGFQSMCFFRRSQRRFSGVYSSTTKYMTIEYMNGNVNIIFRKENRDESSSTI